MSTALSALQTSSEALRVVSSNVANLNTQGYARRVVNEQTQTDGAGGLAGVDIADIQRVVDQFQQQETLAASSASSRYDTQNNVFQQLNAFLGQPGDGAAITTQLGNIFSALGQAQLSPTSAMSQQSVVGAMQSFASNVSQLAGSIQTLQGEVDQQVTNSIGTVNSLIKQVYNLNTQIATAQAEGDTSTSLLDQRDIAVKNLSQQLGVKTVTQSNGSVSVMTQDGVNLVGATYAQLSYTGGSNGYYPPIAIQDVNPTTGLPAGAPQSLDPHLGGGALQGLIDMRDGTLAGLGQEIGNFARNTANAFNAVSNTNTAYPPPTTMTGRNTGMLDGDNLPLTGTATIGLTDSSGNLTHQIAIDFNGGTITVDGGAGGFSGFGPNMASFSATLNWAMQAADGGTATFTNGQLSLDGNGEGIVVQGDPTAGGPATPSQPFSQFFGLNDVFSGQAPSNLATGVVSGDWGGFTDNTGLTLTLKGPSGDIAKSAQVSVASWMTVGDVVNAMNAAMNGTETFTLGSDGTLTATPAANYSGYSLQVSNDTTTRGTTGLSVSSLFGLGTGATAAQALGFQVKPSLVSNPSNLGLAQASDISTAVLGQNVVAHGNNDGGSALQALASTKLPFAASGNMTSQTTTLGDYAAGFYQDIATRAQAATDNKTNEDSRYTDAQAAQAATSGVNLDEELSNMLVYQQAYSAGARMLTVVDQLYQTLLQIQ
jgi:flagellar hook-associated protein 1 FlgK